MKQFTARCSHCGHSCRRDALDSMYPDENTPPEDISISLGEFKFSLYCTDPNCRKYTITCVHPQDAERLTDKYITKNG
jgi:hypothetical protein